MDIFTVTSLKREEATNNNNNNNNNSNNNNNNNNIRVKNGLGDLNADKIRIR